MSKGTAKSVNICGKEIYIGDFVKVMYTADGRFKNGTVEGKITELWSPEKDKHLQGRVESGWCFHDGDIIVEHKRSVLN